VQGKWENRSQGVIPCKVILTLEETRQEEPTGLEAKPKPEYTEEEKAAKKAALQAIRDATRTRLIEPAPKKAASPENDKKQKLISNGYDPKLVELICKSNVHEGSPNFNALVLLWKGGVSGSDFPDMKPKDLNTFMNKLRALLISNETGKAIVTKNVPGGISYRLADFKLEIIEEVA
jgi:hypothetical protein